MVDEMHKKRTFGKSLLLLIAILFFFTTPAYALDVTLQWDANQDTVTGYYIYYRVGSSGGGILANYDGTVAFEGPSPIDVPLNLDENDDPDIVEFTVTDLPNSNTYYFVVTAYNNDVVLLESSASNEVSSDAPPPADTTAPVISNIQATSITDTSAVITWTTDEASDSEVQYGTTSGSYPSNVNSTNMVTSHSINLSGLSQDTTYYYRVRSEDASTNARTSSEMSFATNPTPDGTAPSIVQYPTINYAADTIDVTYSEPVGSELVTNGGFSSNVNNWGAGYSAQLDSVTGGQSGNCLRITENGNNLPYAAQGVSFELGKVYRASVYVKAGTETDFKFYAVATQVAGFTTAQTATSSWTEWSFTLQRRFIEVKKTKGKLFLHQRNFDYDLSAIEQGRLFKRGKRRLSDSMNFCHRFLAVSH